MPDKISVITKDDKVISMEIELLSLMLGIIEFIFWGILFFKGKELLKKVKENE